MPGSAPARAMFTAGAARAATIVFVALRAKLVASLLGPAGIGLLGLLTSAQEIAAQTADGGLAHGLPRQIATSMGSPGRLSDVRRAAAVIALLTALAGAAVFWVFRAPMATLLTGDAGPAATFGLLAAGVGLTVVFRWQQALLTGFRQVVLHARLLVLATGLATVIGVAVVWLLGAHGLIWAALATPAAGVLIAPFFTRRLPRLAAVPHSGSVIREGPGLVGLGLGLMAIALTTLAAPMVLRGWLAGAHGLEAAGLYQAAWVISMQAMAVLLGGVAADFYPRLSAVGGDPRLAQAAVNRQIGLHMAIGGPALLAGIALAPWMLEVLFAAPFRPAGELLRWQFLACMIRLAAVPLESLPTALGRPWILVPATLATQGTAVAISIAAFGGFGLTAIGAGFAIGAVAHLAVVWSIARRSIGFRWERAAAQRSVLGIGAALALVLLAPQSGSGTAVVVTAAILGALAVSGRAGLSVPYRR